MTHPLGASTRHIPLNQSLDRFTPEGIQALAIVGLALLDAINSCRLVVSDRIDAAQANRTRMLIEATYPLQDALHGSDEPLPAALESFIRISESGVRHG